MPKIFGKVVMMPGQARCTCRACNYTWTPTNDEYSDLIANKKVTCLMCRLTKEHAPGQPMEATGPLSRYMVESIVMGAMQSILRSDEKYKDYAVPIRSLDCGHLFTIKSRYIYSWMKEPECLKCNPDRESKLSDIDITEPIKQHIKPNINKVRQPTADAFDSGIDKNKLNKEKIEKDMQSLVGKEQNNATIIDVDIANAEVVIHCNICGKERHISYATYKKYTEESLICPDCKLKKPTLENLYTKYIGKCFNGMKITDIYRGGNKHTLCTVQCRTNSKHEYKNKELGIIINSRFYCPDCTDSGKKDIAEVDRLQSMISTLACRKIFESKYGIKLGNYGYNSSGKVDKVGLTAEKFYKRALEQGASLCFYCSKYTTCKSDSSQTKMSMSYISSQANLLDNINEAKLDVSSRCPSVYGPMHIEGASVCDTDVTRELLMFRDAYRGRDKLVYRFCKCLKHGTEMLMTETEILDFDHAECHNTNKKIIRFFDLDNEVLLGNKKTTTKKK